MPHETAWPKTIIRIVTFAAPILLLVIVVNQPWENPKYVFQDPLVAAEAADKCCSVYFGFMSQVGVLVWVSTAAICLFSALLMFLNGAPLKLVFFAVTAGLLTGWLGLDDAFLIHERVLPGLGIPQVVVLMSYVILTLVYLTASFRIIMKNDYLLLMAGCTGFVISLALDLVSGVPLWAHLEDSAKFFGICCWASFHISSLLKMQLK